MTTKEQVDKIIALADYRWDFDRIAVSCEYNNIAGDTKEAFLNQWDIIVTGYDNFGQFDEEEWQICSIIGDDLHDLLQIIIDNMPDNPMLCPRRIDD